MRRQDEYRIESAPPRARAIALKAQAAEEARRFEFAFLMTAMVVFIGTTGLLIKFSFF